MTGTSGGARRWLSGRIPAGRLYAVVGGLVILSATGETLTIVQDGQRHGWNIPLSHPIIWQASSALLVLALLPWVQWSTRAVRNSGGRAVLATALALGALGVFCTVHVLGMVSLRHAAYAALGRTYSYPWTVEQLLYEGRKDTVTFIILFAMFLLYDRWRLHPGMPRNGPAGDAAAASSAGKLESDLWLRDGAASLRVEPNQVAWVGSAGNYVEYVLADGKRHLIRGTLSGEEARLEPLGIVRIHRTRLINVRRAVSITPRPSGDAEVRLDTGEVVVCSRRYRHRLRALR